MGRTLADELSPSYALDLGRVDFLFTRAVTLVHALHETGSLHPALHPEMFAFAGDVLELPLYDGTPLLDPPYAAPETLHDGTLTPASNIYSLGVLLRELLGDRIVDPRVSALIVACTGEPAGRPSARELRAAIPYFDWAGSDDPALRSRPVATPRDATEASLLAALRANPQDTPTRQVYADWLEQHGLDHRAQALRQADGEVPAGASVAPDDSGWRAVVSRAAIARCGSTGLDVCPVRWDALRPTRFDNVRNCRSCLRSVVYCTSLAQAQSLGARGEPMVVDAAVDRTAALATYQAARRDPVVPMPGPPLGTWNPPPPRWDLLPHVVMPTNPPDDRPMPTVNPPPPPRGYGYGDRRDDGVLARFFGWFKKKR